MEHRDFQIRGFSEICLTRSLFLSRLTTLFDLFFLFFVKQMAWSTEIPDRRFQLNLHGSSGFPSRLSFIITFQSRNLWSGIRVVNDSESLLSLKKEEKHGICVRFTRGENPNIFQSSKFIDKDAITNCCFVDTFLYKKHKIKSLLPFITPNEKTLWSGNVILGART